jgi:iron complex outermembrane receptor protein
MPNVNGMLAGRVAGVNVTLNTGEPGSGAQVRIRGGTSISASSEPLYVIDGVPINNVSTEAGGIGLGGSPSLPRSPLTLINPNDIANITVLKDASATAIYGSRGANGVILIETKQGKGGAGQMEYEGYIAGATIARPLDVLNGDEYRAFVQQQVTAGKLAASRLTSQGTANTNWQDAVTHTGVTQNHNLSFSGGTGETRYRASLNYTNQQGVVIANGFERYQGRLNANTSALEGKLLLGLNLTSAQTNNKYLPFETTGGFEGGVFNNMVSFNPTRSILTTATTGSPYYELGSGRQSQRNPVGLANQVLDNSVTNRTLGNVTAAYELFSGLTASANIGVDKSVSVRNHYFPAISPAGAEYNGLAAIDNRNVASTTAQTLLTYKPNIGESREFELVGGYEYARYTTGGFGAQGRNFLTDAFNYNNLGAGATLNPPYSYGDQSNLASFFGKANVSFKNRYFLTGVVRRDGSSKFGAGNKWSTFPAVSASWKISDEGFMASQHLFSDLRLRAGYGLQGNQGVQPYASLTLLGTDGGARYVFGNTVYTGVIPTQNPNPNLKWEQTAQTSFALDYGLHNNKFTGTLEFYNKKTKDLLLTVAVPQPAVVSTQLQNIGSVSNKGFEASIDAALIEGARTNASVGLVLSVDRNKVESLGSQPFIATGSISGQGQSGNASQRLIPGQAIGTFYGPEFAGVNASGQQQFNKYTVTRDAAGNETSRKLNGTTLAPGGDDNVILGTANPKMSLGVRTTGKWGNFDWNALIRSDIGNKVFNNTALVYATKSNVLQDKNFLKSALTDGIGINEPAIFSSRYIENGSFVRLANITLGYSVKLPGMSSKSGLTRFYISGDNLLMLTKYTGYDPEVFADAGLASRGVDYLAYPRARTVTTGVRVGF